MFRFIMPDPELDRSGQIHFLNEQFDAFLYSDALRELFCLLDVDRSSFSRIYNGRRFSDGKVLETQELEPLAALDQHRERIYPLLEELGFFSINKPVEADHSHLVVLGGSLEACYTRTEAAKNWTTPAARSIDGLACYRPINPKERVGISCLSDCDTEFRAMAESFTSVFSLTPIWTDDFQSDRNLNSISCVRSFFDSKEKRQYRVFAAPSTQPEQRRADTGDSFLFYLQKTKLSAADSLLFLTNNRYCNRQFLQIAFLLMKQEHPVRFDIIGCTPDERVISCERYDPFQFFQDLIGVLDWIDLFMREM